MSPRGGIGGAASTRPARTSHNAGCELRVACAQRLAFGDQLRRRGLDGQVGSS
jgi:hypothetical protein